MSFSNKSLNKGKFSKKRFQIILDKYLKIENDLKKEDILGDLANQAGVEKEDVKELMQQDPEITLHHAILIKRLSEMMYAIDKSCSKEELEAVKDRQIDWYYKFLIADRNIFGHVEAVHGTRPNFEVMEWCAEKGVVDWDEFVNEIVKEAKNWAYFKKPRVYTDLNFVPDRETSGIMSEGAVFTNEYNLNALKAQRDLTEKILKYHDNLTHDKQAKDPYLAVYLHGKVDTHGHDFEIGARQINGKGPVDPAFAFWFKEKLEKGVKKNNLKNHLGQPASVNVVCTSGFYAGSSVLTRMRYGDFLFEFKGFGDNFQALQLECGWFMRVTYVKEIAAILNEVLDEFSLTFKSFIDLDKIRESYFNLYLAAMEKQRSEMFAFDKILFKDDLPLDVVALSKSLRRELNVEEIDEIKLFDKKFKISKMNVEDLRIGKTILLNSIYRELCENGLEF